MHPDRRIVQSGMGLEQEPVTISESLQNERQFLPENLVPPTRLAENQTTADVAVHVQGRIAIGLPFSEDFVPHNTSIQARDLLDIVVEADCQIEVARSIGVCQSIPARCQGTVRSSAREIVDMQLLGI